MRLDLLSCVLLLTLSACSPASAAPTVYGIAQGKEGDSLMVGQTKVRLFSYADFVPASTLRNFTWRLA